MSKAVIAVVGSAMIDLTAYAKVIPAPGQTLEGELFTTGFGGKGANQAVIAAHCGAEVHFVGKLGKDLFGESIAENFKKLGIDSEYVERSDTPNGVAHIWVDANGENRIIIIPGANHEIESKKAIEAIETIADLAVVVAQCEIKQEVTLAAFSAAKKRGCVTILNPAPYQPLSEELLAVTDWIIPNETEFKELFGQDPTSDEILKKFRLGKNSIVTLGSEGAVLITSDGNLTRVSAPKVNAVDTTGAGDAFVGVFAFGLASRMNPEDAMKLGIKVASLSVTRKGAQSSYPSQTEIETLS
ncbi:MAG: ribokinase [Actinobacteria bacterium]|jgi:ribokinase|nr:ribokinase [Actinomycetota bacterium]NCV82014.1 ribokinase [Actinomycetota bacterium]NCW43032.1 ribokinase [Actinomycetota bacterium]NCW71574.1 ribokinase [Actinomycetota bacterium]NCW92497.1 ribokinase [Actinomycetota bacterium]